MKLTTKFTISVSKKTDVIVLHGTEGRDGISWQDVTHYSTIDEASEEVTTEMEHFTVRLVLVRRTLICLKSIAYWLTSFSFHYTLSVLMKKSDKGSKLNLVLMSQEVYNECKNKVSSVKIKNPSKYYVPPRKKSTGPIMNIVLELCKLMQPCFNEKQDFRSMVLT